MPAQPTSETPIVLRTSEFSCFFEPQTGFLRQLMVDDSEVIRAIYGAVRDHNWNTIPARIAVSRIETGDDHFRLEFQVESSSGEIDFDWNGTIQAKAGALSFDFSGEAKSTFKKNRIGLCLLHPIRECAGKRCQIHDTENNCIETEFPHYISPHQPFKNLGSISWEAAPTVEATVTFTGDLFETEDQRNWTDASFKTYCTPLERPFPAIIEAGMKVNQRIEVVLVRRTKRAPLPNKSKQESISVNADEEKPFPLIGVSINDSGKALTTIEREKLAALKLDHLRVDLCFDRPDWQKLLARVAVDAKAIGARLQPALFISGEEDLRLFASTVDKQLLQSCLIFHVGESSTSDHWLESASKLLLEVAVVGGTNANFAELNRRRPSPHFPTVFSINPQVHAFDDLSAMENLEAQPETIQSLRQFSTQDIFISPITLRPRSNPNATTVAVEPPDGLPSSVDARQRTLLGAAWTVGSLARLLPLPGIKSLTYYETIGWKGLLESERGSLLPDQFESKPGEIFAIYHVFHALADAKALYSASNPIPQKIAVIGFRKNQAVHVLLSNLQPDPVTATLRVPAEQIELQILGDWNLTEAGQGKMPTPECIHTSATELKLTLPKYAVAIVRCIQEES